MAKSALITSSIVILDLLLFPFLPGKCSETTHPPIPPGTVGEVALSEYPVSATLVLKSFHARLFKLEDPAFRISWSDPDTCSVIPNSNDVIILGGTPGTSTVTIWDGVGKKIGLNVIVEENVGCTEASKTEPNSSPPIVRDAVPIPLEILEKPAPKLTDPIYNGRATTLRAYVIERALKLGRQRAVRPPPASTSSTDIISKPREDWLFLPYPEPGDVLIKTDFPTDVPGKIIHVFAGQSRTFETAKKIVQVICANPSVAEPIVFSTTQFVLCGKIPGTAQLEIQTQDGVKEASDLVVTKFPGKPFVNELVKSELKARILKVEPLVLTECKTSQSIVLKTFEPKLFEAGRPISRIATADGKHVEIEMISTKEFLLAGKMVGQTNVFVWDDCCHVKKLRVCIIASGARDEQTSPSNTKAQNSTQSAPEQEKQFPVPSNKVEVWDGGSMHEQSVYTEEEFAHANALK